MSLVAGGFRTENACMLTSLASASRVVLLPTARRTAGPGEPSVRRFRLARLTAEPRSREERHGHLKVSHD